MSWPFGPATEPAAGECLCLVEGLRSRSTNDTGNDPSHLSRKVHSRRHCSHAPRYLNHHIWNEYLIHKDYASHLAHDFYGFFTSHLEQKFPVGEWTTLGLVNFFKYDMARCAITAVFGTKLFELNPDFMENFWKLDEVMAIILTAPLPKFLNPKPYKIQARLCDMMRRYLDFAWANFDWEDREKAESHWDEYFGARMSREAAKWMKSFCMETQTGFFSGLVFG